MTGKGCKSNSGRCSNHSYPIGIILLPKTVALAAGLKATKHIGKNNQKIWGILTCSPSVVIFSCKKSKVQMTNLRSSHHNESGLPVCLGRLVINWAIPATRIIIRHTEELQRPHLQFSFPLKVGREMWIHDRLCFKAIICVYIGYFCTFICWCFKLSCLCRKTNWNKEINASQLRSLCIVSCAPFIPKYYTHVRCIPSIWDYILM